MSLLLLFPFLIGFLLEGAQSIESSKLTPGWAFHRVLLHQQKVISTCGAPPPWAGTPHSCSEIDKTPVLLTNNSPTSSWYCYLTQTKGNLSKPQSMGINTLYHVDLISLLALILPSHRENKEPETTIFKMKQKSSLPPCPDSQSPQL